MGERIWDEYLTEQDKQHVAATPRPPIGFGTNPAVLSVDNYRWAVGDEPQPLLESIRTWPASTGLAGWEALSHIEQLLASARAASVPVLHVTRLSEEESAVAHWARERPGGERTDPEALERKRRRWEIVPQAAPLPGELVLRKAAPSAFFGTPLMSYLSARRIDTLIVCGESTSGCVRATVVDGRSYRLHMIVVEECVYDRHEAAHAINLFDMDQKYADVLPLDAVTSWLSDHARSRADLVDA